MGFLLMYDITSQESFCAVQDWYVPLMVEMVDIYKVKHHTEQKVQNLQEEKSCLGHYD